MRQRSKRCKTACIVACGTGALCWQPDRVGSPVPIPTTKWTLLNCWCKAQSLLEFRNYATTCYYMLPHASYMLLDRSIAEACIRTSLFEMLCLWSTLCTCMLVAFMIYAYISMLLKYLQSNTIVRCIYSTILARGEAGVCMFMGLIIASCWPNLWINSMRTTAQCQIQLEIWRNGDQRWTCGTGLLSFSS